MVRFGEKRRSVASPFLLLNINILSVSSSLNNSHTAEIDRDYFINLFVISHNTSILVSP